MQTLLNVHCSWSRWITPVTQPKRFDTTFFLYILPQQSVNSSNPLLKADGTETASAEWVSACVKAICSALRVLIGNPEYSVRSTIEMLGGEENHIISSTGVLASGTRCITHA